MLQPSQNIVISAGIAEIQRPRMASDEHIPVVWIPAVHAGMTLLLKHLYNQVKLCIKKLFQQTYWSQIFFRICRLVDIAESSFKIIILIRFCTIYSFLKNIGHGKSGKRQRFVGLL
jgi:hypothetical protein